MYTLIYEDTEFKEHKIENLSAVDAYKKGTELFKEKKATYCYLLDVDGYISMERFAEDL